MEFEYNGHSNKSGVYKITNNINKKIYIGSCKRFRQRSREHFTRLKNNKHQNKHLQSSFNKHGSNAFLFEVLEVVDGYKFFRTKREKELLDEQIELGNWENCFNFQKNPIAADRSCFSKNPEETKRKISEYRKNFLKENPEIKEKLNENLAKFRKNGRSQKTKNKIGAKSKAMWSNPDFRKKMLIIRKNQKSKTHTKIVT